MFNQLDKLQQSLRGEAWLPVPGTGQNPPILLDYVLDIFSNDEIRERSSHW